jgi:hypothetical protein
MNDIEGATVKLHSLQCNGGNHMKTHATGNLDMKNWDEKPYDEGEGQPKLARASIETTFQGDIEAEGKLEYLLSYHGDSAHFVGFERVSGRIGKRTGSFVLQHSGIYEEGGATCTWFVVPGSGTGGLQGLRGEGGYAAQHNQPSSFTLDYEIV